MLRQERPHRSCIGGERALSAKRSPPEFVAAALPPKIAARKAQCFRAVSAVSASAVLSALFRGSAIQRHSASVLPRPPRFSASAPLGAAVVAARKAQRFRAVSASAVLSALFRGSVLQRHSASVLPRFRVLRVLRASASSAIQRHSAVCVTASCIRRRRFYSSVPPIHSATAREPRR